MVVWTDKEIGTMVEQLCGPEVRTNFDGVECGPNEHFPSRDEYNSDEDTSSDDSVEEIYVEAAATTNVIAAATINANDDGHVCEAGELCSTKANILDGLHSCMNCGKLMHGALCGTLWAERGDTCKITVEHLTDLGKNKTTTISALICNLCMKH